MESLKSIIARRRTAMPHERFASIVFTIYTIDATALISCSISGTAVLDQAFREYIPTSLDFMRATPLLPTDPVTTLDWEILGPAYSFLHDLVILWTTLGQTSCQIRQEIQEHYQIQGQDHPGIINPYTAAMPRWHTQVLQTREALKQLWHATEPPLVPSVVGEQQILFEQTRKIYEQVSHPYFHSYNHLTSIPHILTSCKNTGHTPIPLKPYLQPHKHMANPSLRSSRPTRKQLHGNPTIHNSHPQNHVRHCPPRRSTAKKRSPRFVASRQRIKEQRREILCPRLTEKLRRHEFRMQY